MLTVFWDWWGVIHQEYLSKGRNSTANAERYSKTLFNLRTSIKIKRSGLLSRGVVFLHDNARPPVASFTQPFLKDFCWDVPPHLLSYSQSWNQRWEVFVSILMRKWSSSVVSISANWTHRIMTRAYINYCHVMKSVYTILAIMLRNSISLLYNI